MTVTATSFKARFAEFSALSDARVEVFLDEAFIILNETYWDDKYDLGVLYYSAHNLYLDEKNAAGNGGGISGPIAGRSVDGTSVTYGQGEAADASDAFFASTLYGQKYLALRKNLGVPACVI